MINEVCFFVCVFVCVFCEGLINEVFFSKEWPKKFFLNNKSISREKKNQTVSCCGGDRLVERPSLDAMRKWFGEVNPCKKSEDGKSGSSVAFGILCMFITTTHTCHIFMCLYMLSINSLICIYYHIISYDIIEYHEYDIAN